MKSIYKIIAVVLCVGMIFSFAACKKDSSADNKTSTQVSTQTSATQGTSTASSTTASAASSGNAQGDQSATQSAAQSTAQSTAQSAAQSAGQSGQGGASSVDATFKAAFDKFAEGKSQFDPFINKGIWTDNSSIRNYVISGRTYGTMNGNETFTIARDGNKAFVNDNGIATYYVINADNGTYDFYATGEWSRGNALTDEVKSIFQETLSIYTEEIASSISPFKGYDIAAEDFTYDQVKKAYVTSKEIVDNGNTLSDINVYLNGGNIAKIYMNMSGPEYSEPVPVVIEYSYDENGNLVWFGDEIEMIVQGFPMTTVLNVEFNYDEQSRIVGYTSEQTIMGMTDNVSLTIDYNYTITLPE